MVPKTQPKKNRATNGRKKATRKPGGRQEGTSLTPRQARFIKEYLVDLNATQAAVRAGYSQKTASIIGQENLRKPNIATAIKDAQQQRSARTDVTADAVVRELAYIAFGDISGLFDAQGRLREAHDLAPGVRARIAAIDVVRERTRAVGDTTVEESSVKVRVWDKVRALELLAKHLGLLTEQVNVTLVADRDRLLEAGRQRNADATKHDREG